MSNDRNFTEVGQGGSNNPRWEPQKMQFNPQAPPYIDGYLKSMREQTGPNGVFMVATIVTVDQNGQLSQEYDVSGGAVLDQKLDEIQLGSFVRVVFGGKQASKTGGRSYNVWNTYVDGNAIPFQNLGGVVRASTPAPVQLAFAPPVQQQPVFNPGQGFQQPLQSNPVQTFQPPVNQQQMVQQQVFTPPATQQFQQQVPAQPTVAQVPWTPPVANANLPASQHFIPPATQQFQQPVNNGIPNPPAPVQYGGGAPSTDLPF